MPTPHPYVAKDGSTTWRVRFRKGKAAFCETFDTEPDAQRFCADIANRGAVLAHAWLLTGTGMDTSPSLDAWAERHFGSLTGASKGTVTAYRSVYERRWKPALGHMPVGQITREHIARAVAALPDDLSDKTVRNAWGVLASMLKQAAADGIIARSPGVGVKLPRRSIPADTKRYLSQAEFHWLLVAVDDHYRPLVMFLGGTGARFGEAVALTVADVDLESRPATVRINKAEKWGRKEIGPTKTRRSRRTVTLPPQVVAALAPLTVDRPGSAFLFTAEKGGKVHHGVFYTKVWKPACEKAGLEPRPRPHDLRHSQVAWLVARGVPLPVIQARLGHEKITTTIDTYGHLLPELQQAAADAASLVFGPTMQSIER